MSDGIIHYVDAGEFFSVYGIATLIVLLLLLWYFVRTTIEEPVCDVCRRCHRKCMGNCPGKNRCRCNYCAKAIEGMVTIEDQAILDYFPEFHWPEPTATEIVGEPKPYKLTHGTYGDVPVKLFDVTDRFYESEWIDPGAIILPNQRTSWQLSHLPIEAITW